MGKSETLDLQIAEFPLGMRPGNLQARHPIDDIDCQAEAIGLIFNRQLERSIDVALLFVAADMEIIVIGAPVGEPVD